MNIACLLILITTTALVDCYCPRDKIHKTGKCTYRIECNEILKGFILPEECTEATNYPVSIDLTLIDTAEKFDDKHNVEMLKSVTTLKISTSWSQTNLSILQYTNQLQGLILSRNGIEVIRGTPFYYLINLERLDLSFNKLSIISNLFKFEYHPNKLRDLSLSHNSIEEIPIESFNELTSLTTIDLSYNIITNLKEEPFHNLTNLELLKLNNNRIKDLNGAVNNLRNLKHLYLRGNQIQNIDVESLKIITHLETFDVSWNNLEQIKPIMLSRHWNHLGSHSVCKIILSENHITSVPNGTAKEISDRYVRHSTSFSVDVLTELDLSRNDITSIEYNAFQELVKLISLNLSKNKITAFDVNPNDLIHVKFLNLSSNYITHLYFASFSSMNNLFNLDLSHNKLDDISKRAFINSVNLKYVNMTYNDLEEISSININMFHRDGGMLDLSHNGLTHLVIPYGEGLRLTNLILNSNNISEAAFVELIYQSDLRYLDLSNNIIELLSESSLRLPNNLLYLDLSCNAISNVGPSTFYRVNRLTSLKLSHNRLHSIEYGAFRGLITLQTLDLSFNSIPYLDSKLFMDLKSLRDLSLRNNGMNYLRCEAWYSHNTYLKVYIDYNNFTCEWLAEALSNYNNGFSNMRPIVVEPRISEHSIEGIPCIPSQVAEQRLTELADERLLVTSQKILEAVREQTSFIKMFLRRVATENSDG